MTREIVGSVANASQGVIEVNNAMASSAHAVERMSEQVAGTHDAAAAKDYRSSQANLSAEDLAAIARQVDRHVNQFKLRQPKFNMGAVKGAHLSWRYKLHAVINGHTHMDAGAVASHTECAFGPWVASPEGQRLAWEPASGEVCSAHEKVHQVAQEIAAMNNRGMREEAASLMAHFEDARARFFTARDALFQ